MMKPLLLSLALLLACSGDVLAKGFNCVDLPFGERLATLNAEQHFIKYMEKEGVAYYNYVGPCHLEQQQKLNLAIAYAFVDEKLYARIITIVSNAEAKADKALIVKNLSAELDATPAKEYAEGDWHVYAWNITDKQLKFKLKFNNKTTMSKSAFYYAPLKPAQDDDALLPVPQ
ncbi:hypothetical protein [Megalodesulfovibrio gigas]|uniref:Lipoprotein n=1 Tax=Megalodesulfovibrio gigas (strain ATCC 19364 / DSM 1382 / NCIMB 9332 / VKM B-1759) TaxID=1121448 RepID=T2G817_MEGG1|nr:hypothetical protein [Megalodesulfovibrio gigas]AGW12324.1 hypothetical protein DGI_0405 [Megalodesulfovibrio gigas DSM 1382 = ATCC 19364]